MRGEEEEGPWTLVQTECEISKEVDVRDSLLHTRASFLELVENTQDDSGVIALMQHLALQTPQMLCYIPRSHSQPPSLRRREVAYHAAQRSEKHLWLSLFHLCPLTTNGGLAVLHCHQISHHKMESPVRDGYGCTTTLLLELSLIHI